MIKTVIAENQPIIREGIKLVIQQDNEIIVIGDASTEQEACDLCESIMPDVILLDMAMPVCDDREGVKPLKEKFRQVKVVVLDSQIENQKIAEALMNGADGYVFKGMRSEELILAIKSVAKGLKVMHEDAYNFLIAQIKAKGDVSTSISSPEKYNLTQREMEIIRLIVGGSSYKEVAAAVYLSEGSVRNIISDILTKLKLKDRLQMAVFAVRNGLV